MMNATATIDLLSETLRLEALKDILELARGGRTYEQIAIRVSDWLREQGPSGHLGVAAVTSEQIRKMFRGLVAKPHRAYLDGLSAVLDVPIGDLLVAVGYMPDPDRVRRVEFALNGELLDPYEATMLKDLIDRHTKPESETK